MSCSLCIYALVLTCFSNTFLAFLSSGVFWWHDIIVLNRFFFYTDYACVRVCWPLVATHAMQRCCIIEISIWMVACGILLHSGSNTASGWWKRLCWGPWERRRIILSHLCSIGGLCPLSRMVVWWHPNGFCTHFSKQEYSEKQLELCESKILVTMTLNFDSCPDQISYIVRPSDTKPGIWIHLGMKFCQLEH